MSLHLTTVNHIIEAALLGVGGPVSEAARQQTQRGGGARGGALEAGVARRDDERAGAREHQPHHDARHQRGRADHARCRCVLGGHGPGK